MDMRKQTKIRPVQYVLLLLLPVLLLFSACGRAADTSGLSGMWRLYDVESGTVTIPESLVNDNMLRLRLDPDGSGKLFSGETEGRITWRYDQGILTLRAGTTVLTGNADETGLALQQKDSDTVLHFRPEDETADGEYSAEAVSAEAFLGDWYGWWKIEDSSGTLPVSWYDCCACFSSTEEGTVQMTLWDEDGSRNEALAEVTFTVQEDGTLLSQNGYFLYSDVTRGGWILDLPDPAIYVEGIQHDAEDEQFCASFYLRAWGDRWEDAAEEQKPFYYQDWYIPLLEKGSTMPEQIPWERLEKIREQPKEEIPAGSYGS